VLRGNRTARSSLYFEVFGTSFYHSYPTGLKPVEQPYNIAIA
jgi:hypothetical protein